MICSSCGPLWTPNPISLPVQERVLVIPAQVPPAVRAALRGAGESQVPERQGRGRIPERSSRQPQQCQQAAGEAAPLLRGGTSQGDEFQASCCYPHAACELCFGSSLSILVTFSSLCSAPHPTQVQETEALYKMCINDANFRRQELEKVRARIVSHIRKLIYQGDEVLTWVCVIPPSHNFSSSPHFRENPLWHKTISLFFFFFFYLMPDHSPAGEIRRALRTALCHRPAAQTLLRYIRIFSISTACRTDIQKEKLAKQKQATATNNLFCPSCRAE